MEEELAEFEADGVGADDNELRWDVGEFERLG